MQEPNSNKIKTSQPQRGSDKEAQYSLPEEVGGGWWPGHADQPGSWAPQPQPGHVASPHWSPTSDVKALM